ncbi:hypothetical protein CPHO_03920 [Corynebacterium phocae]|uniref:Uncharacterized protein n=2 Tax=Corynebacterium phocae TaxID=161895 RepID=A0A1L7D242_9CORY|nr:hypothetical protein CPHO_03920 [Corynebacterium phocae]
MQVCFDYAPGHKAHHTLISLAKRQDAFADVADAAITAGRVTFRDAEGKVHERYLHDAPVAAAFQQLLAGTQPASPAIQWAPSFGLLAVGDHDAATEAGQRYFHVAKYPDCVPAPAPSRCGANSAGHRPFFVKQLHVFNRGLDGYETVEFLFREGRAFSFYSPTKGQVTGWGHDEQMLDHAVRTLRDSDMELRFWPVARDLAVIKGGGGMMLSLAESDAPCNLYEQRAAAGTRTAHGIQAEIPNSQAGGSPIPICVEDVGDNERSPMAGVHEYLAMLRKQWAEEAAAEAAAKAEERAKNAAMAKAVRDAFRKDRGE